MNDVNNDGNARKFILWVEDFAVNPEYPLDPEEVDPIGENMPYFGFPDHLKKRIDIIRDPTDLPGKMKSEGKNYELIVLDKNFKNDCIDRDIKKARDFVESLRKANINCDGFLKNPQNVSKYVDLKIGE